MPRANSVAMEPPSELLFADSDAITPRSSPLPKVLSLLYCRFVDAYDTKLATDDPTPGIAPIIVPIALPRRITMG